jgi:predicted DNA-binding transcriptional regulator YafY
VSTNKFALIRYKILDSCFRNNARRYFIDDLIKECSKVLQEISGESAGISRRQIFDDISFMESSEGWQIELLRNKEGKKVYYQYADPSFSINNMPLNEIEIHHLLSLIDSLSQFKGMPQFEFLNEILPKLKQGIDMNNQSLKIMEFDNNEYLKGIEKLGLLYNSILYKKVLHIKYKPFENELPFEIEFHPYYLKQYNNRWFVFGYNPEVNKYDWNLAIDRIESIQEISTKECQINYEIEWNEYFDDFIGVTKPTGSKIEDIVLHFYGKTGKYMETKPLHGSQKSSWIDSNIFEVRLTMYINYELERLILSYADSVKVIAPAGLENIIKKRMEQAIESYKININK